MRNKMWQWLDRWSTIILYNSKLEITPVIIFYEGKIWTTKLWNSTHINKKLIEVNFIRKVQDDACVIRNTSKQRRILYVKCGMVSLAWKIPQRTYYQAEYHMRQGPWHHKYLKHLTFTLLFYSTSIQKSIYYFYFAQIFLKIGDRKSVV